MNERLSSSPRRVQEFLTENGFKCVVKELPSSTKTALDAAHTLGCSVAQIAKSLIFIDQTTQSLVLLIVSGVNQVDLEKVQRSTGMVLNKAEAKFVKEKTGFAIGGIPPVAHKEKIHTYLDPTLKEHEWIWAAAGAPFAVFQLRSEDLEKMTEGIFIDLKREAWG